MVKHSVCLLGKCSDDFFIPMASEPHSLPPPRCCSSICCSVYGWSVCKRCKVRSQVPTRLYVSTWASDNGKDAPSRELPSPCIPKPPRVCLRRDATDICALATATIRTVHPYYLVAAAPLQLRPDSWLPESLRPFLISAPYLFFGVMLGASLWYVARRLYGNAGGYIALALYCFSPAMIVNVAGAQSLGEMGGVWGGFGTIFTAIALAHTLYAPREVVLWNWRRILLLGLSLTLAVGNQFSLAVLALVILPLMAWVAPVRPRAVFAIWTAAIAVTAVLLFAGYFFKPAVFWRGMFHARWFDFEPEALEMSFSYRRALQLIFAGSPPLTIAVPVALAAYCGWKRSRYFGNTAPLMIAALLLILAIGAPDFPGQGFHLTFLVFLFVFVSGVSADLIETQKNQLVTAGLCGLLGSSAIWNLWQLWRVY